MSVLSDNIGINLKANLLSANGFFSYYYEIIVATKTSNTSSI